MEVVFDNYFIPRTKEGDLHVLALLYVIVAVFLSPIIKFAQDYSIISAIAFTGLVFIMVSGGFPMTQMTCLPFLSCIRPYG